jgi:FdhE protein
MSPDLTTTAPPPAILLPDPGTLFDRRAQRLAAWADGHARGDYLRFLSSLAAAQHTAAVRLEPSPIFAIDDRWRTVLSGLLAGLATTDVPQQTRAVIERLQTLPPAELDNRAAASLNGQPGDLGEDLFIAAALQVVWSNAAAALDPAKLPPADPPGHCPVCGAAPVAAIIMAGQPLEGVRYLVCGRCASDWHYPRAHCAGCGSDHGVAYLAFAELSGQVRGETCSDCRTYLKVFDEAKSPGCEPFADDLASLGLDLRLGEEGWHRAAANPFLRAVTG